MAPKRRSHFACFDIFLMGFLHCSCKEDWGMSFVPLNPLPILSTSIHVRRQTNEAASADAMNLDLKCPPLQRSFAKGLVSSMWWTIEEMGPSGRSKSLHLWTGSPDSVPSSYPLPMTCYLIIGPKTVRPTDRALGASLSRNNSNKKEPFLVANCLPWVFVTVMKS